MTNKRLVGFKVRILNQLSAGQVGKGNIRSICPILDTLDATTACENTAFDLHGLQPMEATIGQGPQTQVFGTDSMSSFYFEEDGFSLCKDAYNLEFKFCEGDSL